ncbi:MAG TPA: hypothetical protein PL009_13875 [Flavipsychrobacter sp.]|nr:hypothetical protein [Flavipsychrobacter sp.]
MKKLLTLFAFASLSVFMANCSSSKSAASNKMTPEAKVADVKKNFTTQQMEEGKVLWQANCNKCHKMFEPESRNVEKWERVLPRMINRSKLTETQGAMVRAYILSHAKLS